jgi:MFS family permease
MGQREKEASRLPATVLALGAVSLFTDLSSEMIYPLLPAFLVGVLGAGALSLGVIEGVAECTASVLKAASGWWSDRTRRRKPLVLAGYGVSGTARPLIGLAASWPVVLALRFLDRVGKGLRTAPRDALIAGVTPPELRGRAYGLHRAMDHAGAVVGPLVAAGLLTALGVPLRQVFLLAAVPALIVMVVLLLFVREPPREEPPGPRAAAGARRGALDAGFKRLLAALAIFTLGNSSDAFLLLRFGEAGLSPAAVALVWSLHHVVKALGAYGGGRLTDRLGSRALVLGGWAIYAATYLGFALAPAGGALVALFLVYGLYFALSEPAERAWIAAVAPGGRAATAFGVYHGVVGLAALPASVLFGVVYRTVGAGVAFGVGAGLACAAAVVLVAMVPRPGAR